MLRVITRIHKSRFGDLFACRWRAYCQRVNADYRSCRFPPASEVVLFYKPAGFSSIGGAIDVIRDVRGNAAILLPKCHSHQVCCCGSSPAAASSLLLAQICPQIRQPNADLTVNQAFIKSDKNNIWHGVFLFVLAVAHRFSVWYCRQDVLNMVDNGFPWRWRLAGPELSRTGGGLTDQRRRDW